MWQNGRLNRPELVADSQVLWQNSRPFCMGLISSGINS
jgi:hypothetical protein